jgi:predicted aspartyl protease
MRILYLTIIFIITSVGYSQELEGYYSGINKQSIGQEYPLEISIKFLSQGKVSASINYPTLGCGGELSLIGNTYDKRFFFKEVLTKNYSGCVENGTVVIQVLNDKQLIFYWYYENGMLGSATVLNKGLNKISSCNNPIKLYKSSSNLFEMPTEINDVLKISFIIDSGASEISITPDVALTLIRTGTIRESDWLEGATYKFADGSVAKSKRFNIRSLKIGDNTLYNVSASISNSLEAPMLLGQNALSKLGKISIDYNYGILCVEK